MNIMLNKTARAGVSEEYHQAFFDPFYPMHRVLNSTRRSTNDGEGESPPSRWLLSLSMRLRRACFFPSPAASRSTSASVRRAGDDPLRAHGSERERVGVAGDESPL